MRIIAEEGRTSMDQDLRILILEDIADDAELIKRELHKGGIAFSSQWVDMKEHFLRELKAFAPQLILSDYNLPSFDGMSALALAREHCPEVPFIFVSGTIGEEKAIETLKSGATDYVLKNRLSRLVPAVHRALQEVRERAQRRNAEEELRLSHQRLQHMLEGTAQALAAVTEERDPYTAGHQQRVARLACAIGEEMGLPESQIEGIRMAGLIHDIGKIAVPAEILSKPGKISEAEFNIIRTHPQVGYEIVKGIEFPWPVGQAILQHHEMLDGSGYPAGLKGLEILLEARILAAADLVEAMSSHRPYRPARGTAISLEELVHQKGTLYDPRVVDACWELFYGKGFALENA